MSQETPSSPSRGREHRMRFLRKDSRMFFVNGPQDDQSRLALRKLAGRAFELKLVLADGTELEAPSDFVQAFKHGISLLGMGQNLCLVPRHEELSTLEAAEFLNISRPFLIRLLDQGVLPHFAVGSHRRVRLEDLLRYREEREAEKPSPPPENQRAHSLPEPTSAPYSKKRSEGLEGLERLLARLSFSLLDCVSRFLGFQGERPALAESLQALATFLKCNGACLAECTGKPLQLRSLFDWVGESDPPLPEGWPLQGNWWRAPLSHLEMLFVTQPSEGIKSGRLLALAMIPLIMEGKLIGALFFSWGPNTALEEMETSLKRSGEFFTVALALEQGLAALEQTRARLSQIGAECNSWFWELDVSGKLTFITPGVEQTLGIPAKEMFGQHLANHFPPEQRKQLKAELGALMEKREPISNWCVPMICRDGKSSQILLNGTPIRGGDGECLGYRGISTNVTRSYHEQDLALRLGSILEEGPAFFYCTKPTGDYSLTFISESVVRHLGYAPGEFLAEPTLWPSLIHPEDAPRVRLEMSHLFERGGMRCEYRIRHKNGDYRWGQDHLFLNRDERGNPVEISAFWIDSTQTKQLEEECRKLQHQVNSIFSVSPAVHYSCRPFGNYALTFISENIQARLGFESQDFLADPSLWAKLVHPEDAPRVFFERRQLFEKGTLVQEYRIRHRDGSYSRLRDEQRLLCEEAGHPLEIIGSWSILPE